MSRSNNYALIIGVQDYRALDSSGGKNIPGALNDAWIWFQTCLSMGFSPSNIRVLTSPLISVEDLGRDSEGVTLGLADRAGIDAGLEWLGGKLDVDEGVSGLMTFTGHGDVGEEGLPVICPSDTTPSLKGAIQLAELRNRATARVKGNLTVMLDCCHAQAGEGVLEGILARLRQKSAEIPVPEEAKVRVVAACRRDQRSVSARFLGKEMGAFAWAMASVLGQWTPQKRGEVLSLDLSYGNLVARAALLLSALSFEQVPVLSGQKGVAGYAFLQPGSERGRGHTELHPTAWRPGHQVDPSEHFASYDVQLCLQDELIASAQIVSTSPNEVWTSPPPHLAPGIETWVISFAALQKLSQPTGGEELRVTGKAWETPPSVTPAEDTGVFGMQSHPGTNPDGAWQPVSGAPPKAFYGQNHAGDPIGLDLSKLTYTHSAGWSGQMTWYRFAASGSGGPYAISVGDTVTLTWGDAPTATNWKYITTVPGPIPANP